MAFVKHMRAKRASANSTARSGGRPPALALLAVILVLAGRPALAEVEVSGILGHLWDSGPQRFFTPCFGEMRALGPEEEAVQSMFTCKMLEELHAEMAADGLTEDVLPEPGQTVTDTCPTEDGICTVEQETDPPAASSMVWIPACPAGTPGCEGQYIARPAVPGGVAPGSVIPRQAPIGTYQPRAPVTVPPPIYGRPLYRAPVAPAPQPAYRAPPVVRRTAPLGALPWTPCARGDQRCLQAWQARRNALATNPMVGSDSLLVNDAARRQFEALKRGMR